MTVLVPTMGSLHRGHQALIKRARTVSKEVIVSIFVNPLQFENKEDLEKYPRSPQLDIELATLAGATEVWFPEYEDIYPGEITTLSAGPVGLILEGESRPAHFDGVLTVVNRLFEMVKPTHAVFGEKDFQQLFLIKNISKKVEIISVPTVRSGSGLALSSRNIRLSEIEQESATIISKALTAASVEKSIESAQRTLDDLLGQEKAFTKDYAVIIDEKDFSIATQMSQKKRGLVSGWINGIRLIDNMAMNAGNQP
jgi:pantoate--beta-alanine ligase